MFGGRKCYIAIWCFRVKSCWRLAQAVLKILVKSSRVPGLIEFILTEGLFGCGPRGEQISPKTAWESDTGGIFGSSFLDDRFY